MTIQKATLMTTIFGLLGIVMLSGCAASTPTPTDAPPVITSKYASITEDSPEGQAFISQYRSSFPAISGPAERPGRYILNGGVSLCREVEFIEKNEGRIISFDEMKKFVAPRATLDRNTMPQVSDSDADGISRLAITTLCPVYISQLP
jgi:hypothetical protein